MWERLRPTPFYLFDKMKTLLNALEVRARWNNMPLKEFLDAYCKYFNLDYEQAGFTKEWIHNWKYTGLLNTDILRIKHKI